MKLEVGMYIRTKDGKIAKFIKYEEEDKEELITDYYEYSTIWIKDVIEASHNIIDLIEVGDYANGVQVIDKEIDNLNEKYLQCGVGDYVICTYNSNEIEDVVTKEQFEAMEYKVESEVK